MKDNNMLNVESLAEEFNVQPKLIRSTVENIMNYYNIDPALVVKRTTKSGNPSSPPSAFIAHWNF